LNLETHRFVHLLHNPPHSQKQVEHPQEISRAFDCYDHKERDNLEGLVSVIGGKATTLRAMAEKTADLVCNKMRISAPCLTRTAPLTESQPARWTEPGLAPKVWLKHHEPDDILLCECEMVPKNVVDAIVDSIRDQNGQPDLRAIALRSRIGKGACQGMFCGVRVTAYLFDQGQLHPGQCLSDLREFFAQRWKGQHPTLWDKQLMQSELLEALHCGFFGLEL